MRSVLKTTFLIAIIFLTARVAQAQNASMVHFFPQIVDGVASDGTVYTSRFLIAGFGDIPATCQVTLFGMGAERLSAGTRIMVDRSSVETITTRGEDVIATGYARLDCSQPVVASLTYSTISSTGTSLGIATVPSAPRGAVALIPMVLNGRYRYGIAVANDNDKPQVVVFLFDSGPTSLVRTVSVQPRSHYVIFADELFNIPSGALGMLRVAAGAGIGADEFYITALLFDRAGITNVVPLIIH